MNKTKKKSTKMTKAAIAAAVVASSLPVAAVPAVNAAGFSDVSDNNSHAKNIYDLYERGAIKGFSDGTFGPTKSVTRSQAAMIISRVLGLETSNVVDPGFSDVKKTSEAYVHIAALAQAGIINGTDGKFNPNGHLTRGQMAKILARAYKIEGDFKHAFSDIPQNHEYANYINGLAATGITLGKEDGTYDMRSNVQRAQLASFVVRADQYKQQLESMKVTGKIENIAANQLTIAGTTYAVPQTAAFLTNEANKVALTGAEIAFTVKNDELQQVTTLEIFNGVSFDAQNYSFEKLALHKSVAELKNVKVNELIHELVADTTKYINVDAQTVQATAATKGIASLNLVVAAEQPSRFELQNSRIKNFIIDSKSAEIEANAATKVEQLRLLQATSAYLRGNFGAVFAAANALIRGQGQIGQLVADSNTVTVDPQLTVGNMNVAGTLMGWNEAIAGGAVLQSKPSTGGGSGGGSSSSGSSNNSGSSGGSSSSSNSGSSGGSNSSNNSSNSDGSSETPGSESAGSNPNDNVGNSGANGEGNQPEAEEKPEQPEAEKNPEEAGAEQQPEQSNTDNAIVAEKVAEVQALLADLTVTNDMTQAAIEAVVANVAGASVQAFAIEKSTATAQGKVTATISVQSGEVIEEVTFEKEIAIDQVAADQLAIQTTVIAVKQALAAIEVSNTYTEEQLQDALPFEDIEITNFTIEPATEDQAGEVIATILVTKGELTEEIPFKKVIAQLPVNQTTEDTAFITVKVDTAKDILAELLVTNATMQEDLEEALEVVTGVKVEVENFTVNLSTASTTGQVTATIVISKDGVTESFEFTKKIAVDPAAVVAEKVTEVNELLADLAVTNDTTQEDFDAVLASVTGASVKAFAIEKATEAEPGKVTATIVVQSGDVAEEISFVKEIAQLAVDQAAADQQAVAASKAKVEVAVKDLTVTNDFTEADLVSALTGIDYVTVENFAVTEATEQKAGQVTATIVVSKGEAKAEVPFVKAIAQLPVNQAKLDEAAVATSKAAVELAIKNLAVSNTFTQAELEKALAGIDFVTVKDFASTPATATEAGKVTATIVVSKGKAKVEVPFAKEIAQLAVDQAAADQQAVAASKAAVELAIKDLAVSNTFTQAELEKALAEIDFVTVKDFASTPATATATEAGKVTATIVVSKGEAKVEVPFAKEIAQLAVDQAAVAQQAVEAIKTVLADLAVTNAITKQNLEQALPVMTDVAVEVTAFTVNKSTSTTKGEVLATIVVSKGDVSISYDFTKAIEMDTNALVTEKAAEIQTLLADLTVMNETIQADVEAALEKVTGVKVAVTAFAVEKSTATAQGKVTATISVQSGDVVETVVFKKEIAIDQVAADQLALQSTVAMVKQALATIEVSNEYKEQQLKTALQSFEDVAVANFAIEFSTKEQAGKVTALISVTKGASTETIAFEKAISKLPIDQSEIDATLVETKLGTVKDVLAELQVTNATTQKDLEQVLATVTEVTVVVKEFSVSPATSSTTGEVKATVVISKGKASDSFEFKQAIAVDTKALVAEKAATVKELLTGLAVTNETTQADVEAALEKVTGVKVAVTAFAVEKSTAMAQGKVTVTISVASGEVVETVAFEKEMAIDQKAADQQAVAASKAAVELAIKNLAVSNTFTQAELEKALAGIDYVIVKDFASTSATATEAGKVTATIVVSKGEATENVTFNQTITKLIKQVVETVPTVSADNTITIGEEVREVTEETAQALKALQTLQATDVQVSMSLVESADATVALAAVTIQPAATVSSVDLSAIPKTAQVKLVVEGPTTIESLTNTNEVVIEGNGNNVTFAEMTNAENVVLNNVAQADGLVATNVDVTGETETVFSNATIKTLTINDELVTARVASLADIATFTMFAATSTIKITLEATATVEDITINRTDTTVDINKGATVSNVNVKSNNTTIIANTIANVNVLNGVTNLVLGDKITTVKIAKLDINLEHNMVISGYAEISELAIKRTDDTKKVKIESTVIVNNNLNPEAIDGPKVEDGKIKYELINATKFGFYKLLDPTDVVYVVQHQKAPATILETTTSSITYNTTNGIKVDALTEVIALYDKDKKLLGSLSTDPASRPKIAVNAMNTNEELLLLNTTFSNLTDLEKGLTHLIVFKHKNSSTKGFEITKEIEEIGSFPTANYQLKKNTSNPNVLSVPLKNVTSLKYLVIKTDDLVYDTIPADNKNERIQVLKHLAQLAKDHNNEALIYDYLTMIFALEEKTYDSIFTPSIIDALLADQIPNIEKLVEFTKDKTSTVDYQKAVPVSELWLGSGVTKVGGDGTNSTVTVEGSNLLIKANTTTTGTDYVTFKDASGAVSILKVEVDMAATDKVKTNLITTKEEQIIDANTEILYGKARLATNAGKTYMIPAELGTDLVTYVPGTSSATVGTFQSVQIDATGGMNITGITPTTVSKKALNLEGDIARQQKANSGFITTDTEIHFYPTAIPTSTTDATSDQYVLTADGKSTAISAENDQKSLVKELTTKIAKNKVLAADLAMEQIKEITATTTGTTMHTAVTIAEASVFASETGKDATFKVMAQDGKVALVNAKTSGTEIVVNLEVVKKEETLSPGVTMLPPQTANVVRLEGNTIYATGAGEERIFLSDGSQLLVNIKHEATGYNMDVKLVATAIVTSNELDLQSVSVVEVNGTSAVAEKIGNELVSIRAVANATGKTEITVMDGNGKKAIVYVDVATGVLKDLDAAAGDQLYKVARKALLPSDLGLTAITSVSQSTEIARSVSAADKVTFYAISQGSTAFTVTGDGTKKTLVNVDVLKNATTNEFEVKGKIVKKDVVFTSVGLPNTTQFDSLANGKDIVRIEGNTLYALKEGSVDLAIKDSVDKFYRISITKDDVTGQYTFAEGQLVAKSVYTAAALGLSVIETATSSNENSATVEFASDKVTLTTQTVDGTGQITVTGPEGKAFIYISKTGSTLIAEIEDATAILDVKETGLANIKNGDLVGANQVRPQISGSNVNFFVLDGGAAYYKVTDDNGLMTIINVKTEINAGKGHREVVPTYARELVGLKDAVGTITPQTGEIISGTSIRLHDGYAYAVATGKTVVKLADNSLVEYTVAIENGLVKISSEKITNGVAVNDTALDLSGNLTITSAPDSQLITAVAKGNQIIFTGLATNGETSIVVTDGSKTVRAKVVMTDGNMDVTPIKHTLPTGTATKIHVAKTNAWISTDGKTIYAVEPGTFEYIVTDGATQTVEQLTLTAELTKHTLTGPVELPSVIYNATELGLTNALEVQSGFNPDVVNASMVGAQFVAYQKTTGNTDVVVKDGKGQFTLVHFTSNTATAPTLGTLEAHIAKQDTPFAAADYNLTVTAPDTDKSLTVTIANKSIAEMHEDGDLYLLKQGTTYATITDKNGAKAIATIQVNSTGGKLTPTITPVSKEAADLAPGATTVVALPNNLTNSAIVRVAGNKVYAIGAGTTQVKLDGQMVDVTVKEEASTYSITAGALVNFIELPLGEGTYTVADVTGTNVVKAVVDDNATPQVKTDDKLLIYVTANNGHLDLTITDTSGVTIVHHLKVENGVITNPPVTAVETLLTDVVDLALVNTTNNVVQITGPTNAKRLHLLRPGSAALKGTNGLVNVTVTRDETTKYLTSSQTVVEKELRAVPIITSDDTDYKVITKDSKNYLRPLQATAQKVYYTNVPADSGTPDPDNYRIAATTVLMDDVYTLNVEERHMKKVDYASYGLTHDATNSITLHSDKEDIAKAEMVDGELIIYAGAGVTEPSGTTKITATDVAGKKITINVTRTDEGKISYTVAGQVDAIKFADLGINTTDKVMTVEDHKAEYVQATVSATGISLAAQANGTTSMLIKATDANDATQVDVVAIVNINVVDGTAVTDVVKYDMTGFGDVITGNGKLLRTDAPTGYATAEGTVLYEKGNKAIQLRVVKNTDTGLYSISPTSFDLAVGATNLDLAVDANTKLNMANSSIAEAHVNNGKLYVVAKSLGSTDITVANGTDKAVVHAHVTAAGITTNVAAHTPIIAGTYVGNATIQVRGSKLYPLAAGKSTVTLDGTLVTATVTRNADTNEFDTDLKRVEHTFASATEVKLIDATNLTVVVAADKKTIYAKKVGTVQLSVDGKVVDVAVVENADGTYKFDVKELQEQTVLTAEDLGLTLNGDTTVTARSITGSNVVRTEVINGELVIFALGTGAVELTIAGKTIVYVQVTSANNKLVIATPVVAKAKVETIGEVTTIANANPANIRLNKLADSVEIYALDEGTSLVTDTTAGKKSVYKVVAARENNILKVSSSIIEKDFVSGSSEGVISTVVRGTDTGKLIATDVGQDTFDFDGTTYRVTVSEIGEMNVEVLATTEIDLSSVLTTISSNPASTYATLSPITGTAKMKVTAQNIGTEILRVTDGTNTVLVELDITQDATDANKKNVSYEIVKQLISTTELGFHPKSVTALTNGLVKIEGSDVVVYPGVTPGKQYFTVTGEGSTQAIYSLEIDAAGVKLIEKEVSGYTVTPLQTSVAISELGIAPTVVAVDGTAKASVNEVTQKLDIILNNTEKSYVIVKGEGNVYKSIEVQASGTDYTVSSKVHAAVMLDAVTKEALHGPIKSLTDGTKSIVYATGKGKVAYENNGKLFNNTVVEAGGKYSFDTAAEIPVALTSPVLVDGQQNVVKKEDKWYIAAATGSAAYRTDAGYERVDINVVDNHYEETVKPIFSTPLSDTKNFESAVIMSAPATVKLDGQTVFGGTVADEGKVIVVKTVIGEGIDAKVTMYTATIELDSTTTGIKYKFKPVTSNVLDDTGWAPTTTVKSIMLDDPTKARNEDGVLHFLRTGNVVVTVTSQTGLKQELTYNIDDQYRITLIDNNNVISYDVEQFSFEQLMGGTVTNLTFTFDLNVVITEEINNSLSIDYYLNQISEGAEADETLRISVKNHEDISSFKFQMYLPEYGQTLNVFEVKVNPTDLSTFTITPVDPNLKFKFIQ
ncbi:MAG: S-layer homology domain-containing protein [Solibacillus sp.]